MQRNTALNTSSVRGIVPDKRDYTNGVSSSVEQTPSNAIGKFMTEVKKNPILQYWTIIGFLLVQTGGAIWWAAKTSADISYLKISAHRNEQSLDKIRAESYFIADANRDNNLLRDALTKVDDRIKRLEERVLFKRHE